MLQASYIEINFIEVVVGWLENDVHVVETSDLGRNEIIIWGGENHYIRSCDLGSGARALGIL